MRCAPHVGTAAGGEGGGCTESTASATMAADGQSSRFTCVARSSAVLIQLVSVQVALHGAREPAALSPMQSTLSIIAAM